MSYLLPIPDAEGIAKTKELYLNRVGAEITDEQASEVLGRGMRLIYLLSGAADTFSASPPSASRNNPLKT